MVAEGFVFYFRFCDHFRDNQGGLFESFQLAQCIFTDFLIISAPLDGVLIESLRVGSHYFFDLLPISGPNMPFLSKNGAKNHVAKYPQNNSIIVLFFERFLGVNLRPPPTHRPKKRGISEI